MPDTLAELYSDVSGGDYDRKMWHEVPHAQSVNRAQFILDRCRGKHVLSFGHTGPLADAMDSVAKVRGVDKDDCDLDDFHRKFQVETIVGSEEWDVIVCGEVIEHLTNPGILLDSLRFRLAQQPILVTVPNAGAKIYSGGRENVNIDHVCWYSYRTMKTLLERHSLHIKEFYWYNGPPFIAEGLIFCVR